MKKESNILREKAEVYEVPPVKREKRTNSPITNHQSQITSYHYMSEKEFMEKAPDNKIWELRYGELIIHSPVRIVHQSLAGFLFTIIFTYVNAKELGKVFDSPTAIKLDDELIYEPDVFFINKSNTGKLEELRFNGVADLIVEIVSPSMILHDRRTKFVDYERFGVKEYWILDPQNKKYNFYQLKQGKFKEIIPQSPPLLKREKGGLDKCRGGAPSSPVVYKSKEIPGFYIRIEWLENEKYWSERNVNKIIYELIGTKNIIEDIGEEKILNELISSIGKEKLRKLIS